MGVTVRGAVAQGESFRGTCLGGKIPGDNCPGWISYGVIVRGRIIQQQLSGGNCPVGSFMGDNCPGGSCPGGN